MKSLNVRSIAALLICLSVVVLPGCGGGSKPTNTTVVAPTHPRGTRKHLVIVFDRSNSANRDNIRELYKKLTVNTVRGDAMEREGKWKSFRLWGFPYGPNIDPVLELTSRDGKDPDIRTTSPSILKAIDALVKKFNPTNEATNYVVPLEKLATLCATLDGPATIVFCTDGGDQGVSDRDPDSVRAAVTALAQNSNVSEMLVGPVVASSGNVGKIERMFAPMGSKLLIITDTDAQAKLQQWMRRL